MSRTRRGRAAQEQAPAAAGAPPATWKDGKVVVQIANAGVDALIAAAAQHGLVWHPDTLYRPIAETIARALRATPGWWVGRTPEVS